MQQVAPPRLQTWNKYEDRDEYYNERNVCVGLEQINGKGGSKYSVINTYSSHTSVKANI